MLGKLSTCIDSIGEKLAVGGAAIVVFIMLFMNVQVAGRYFLGRPILGVIEISEYALLYSVFMAAAWVVMQDGHVKMDLVVTHLNPMSRAILNIFTSFLASIVCLVITWYGIKVTLDYYQVGFYFSTPLRPSAYMIVAIVPLGTLLMSVQFVKRALGSLREFKTYRKGLS